MDLIFWDNFKVILQKNLCETTFFINNILIKIKRDFQYQLKKIHDYTTQLKYFQLILIEFDSIYTQTKDHLNQYLFKTFKPQIKLWLNKKSQEKLAWEELVKKMSKVEFKSKIQKDKDLKV